MRIMIMTGKGGVGKTGITAATGALLAQKGRKVLLMSTDQAHSLGDALEVRLSDEITEVTDHLSAVEVDPVMESRRAWGSLHDYLKQIISDKANGGLEEDEVLVFPGLEELCALIRILDIVQLDAYDDLIVDCAPTGETLALMRYPESFSVIGDQLVPMVSNMNKTFGRLISRRTSVPKPRDEVFKEVQHLIDRLNELQAVLRDRDHTSIRIVTTAEKIPISEARRSYTWMQEYDFSVDAVYVNKIFPQEAMEGYFADWQKAQNRCLEEVRSSFPKQQIFYLELQKWELRGMDALLNAAGQIYGSRTPDEIFCRETSFRIEEDNGTRLLIIQLPYAQSADIQVWKEEQDLILKVRNEVRRFHLPDRVARRILSGWSFEDGELRIRMDYE